LSQQGCVTIDVKARDIVSANTRTRQVHSRPEAYGDSLGRLPRRGLFRSRTELR
jgi:hypothetical protein